MKKDRLLIIEDEPSVAKQLKWALGQVYDIAVAGEAHTARKLLAAGAFAVATLDLGLPPHPDSPREGLTLLEELPALAPRGHHRQQRAGDRAKSRGPGGR